MKILVLAIMQLKILIKTHFFERRIVYICKVLIVKLDINVLVCLWNWLLINVDVYWYQICISLFQLLNSSSLSIDYCIKLDSLSLERHNIAQAVPAFIQANKTTKLSVGKWTNHFFHQRLKSIEQTFLHVLSQPIY